MRLEAGISIFHCGHQGYLVLAALGRERGREAVFPCRKYLGNGGGFPCWCSWKVAGASWVLLEAEME